MISGFGLPSASQKSSSFFPFCFLISGLVLIVILGGELTTIEKERNDPPAAFLAEIE